MRYSESGKKGWWYGDYSALLYGFVRGEEVKGMKKIDAKEMRAVEGGYSTNCPICGKKVSVLFLNVWFYGKKVAYHHRRRRQADGVSAGGNDLPANRPQTDHREGL